LVGVLDLLLEGFFLAVFFFSGFVVNVGEEGFDGGDLLVDVSDLLLYGFASRGYNPLLGMGGGSCDYCF
jgi:hypothetical protein